MEWRNAHPAMIARVDTAKKRSKRLRADSMIERFQKSATERDLSI
jgi:hypothetical protein